MAGLAPSILTIPLEIAEHALGFCHPRDVASFSETCHLAHTLVYNPIDQYLWRQLFLFHPFDDPRKSLQSRQNPDTSTNCASFDWKGELVRRMKAELIAFSGEERVLERRRALETFITMVQGAPPMVQGEEHEPSYDLQWLVRVLRDSRMLDANTLPNEARLHARLRSYLALSLDNGKDDKTRIRLQERRSKSRCFVYDLRNYHPQNSWGPFMQDGRVNWVHVEALINVVLMNLLELPTVWATTRPPIGLEATRPYSAPGIFSSQDWAGVEGTWRRYVCFMDYRDLFAFNYSNISNGPRDPSYFEDVAFREATRLIELKLHLIPAHCMRFRTPSDADLAVNSDADPQYPPLYFTGTSRGVNGNEAIVEGMVRMGRDGVVNWQFASIYDGHTQWSSQGVQVGNVASAIGIVGVWTTDLHDQGDPVGPFWLWKVDEDHPAHLMEYT